jgi:hypothetical protein
MKIIALFLKVYRILFFGCFLSACVSTDPGVMTTIKPGDTVASLDSIADHFKFLMANKITGEIPFSLGSIKSNIKDTLRLIPGAYIPIKFLHNSSIDVSGAYLQIFVGETGGLFSSYYFDIPKIPDLDNDTVSVLIVQFDPNTSGDPDFTLPLTFNIKITPYDEVGQPIDEGTVPVKVNRLNEDVTKSACEITGGYWDWISSSIAEPHGSNGSLFFYNDPYKIWGRTGQLIYGCCCSGVSTYEDFCPCGDKLPNKALHFSTSERYEKETLTLYENSTYYRQTVVNHPSPFPIESDFCANAVGVVHDNIAETRYTGGWFIDRVSVPKNLRDLFPGDYTDHLYLEALYIYPQGSGYGNPGGLILDLQCDYLLLIQVDLEGFGQDLWKFYKRKSNYQSTDEDDWYDLPES